MTKTALIICFIFLLIIFDSCIHQKEPDLSLNSRSYEISILDTLNKLDLAIDKYKHTDITKALSIARKALLYPGSDSFALTSIKSCLIMGKVLLDIQNDSSLYYFNKALSLSAESQIEIYKPSLLFYLGKLYVSVTNYPQALLLFDSCRRLSYARGEYALLSNSLNEMAGIREILHDYENAKLLYDTAYKIAMSHHLYTQMGASLANLARFESDTISAIAMLKKAIKYLEEASSNEDAIAQIYINLGFEFNNPDSSIKYYEQAIKSLDSGTSSAILLAAYNNMAYSFADKGTYGKAADLLSTKAIPLAKKWNNLDWLASLYDSYAEILSYQHKYSESSLMSREAYKLRGLAYDFDVTGQVRLLSGLLDLKNKELILKSKDQEIQKKKNKIRLLIFIVIGLVVLGALAFWWFLQRKKLEAEKQRYLSASRLINLEESYKRKMAMELHDMTGPIYSTLVSRIEEVNIPDKTIKAGLYESLRDLSDKIRRISHEMAGGFFKDIPFSQLLSGLCEEMQYMTDAKINVYTSQDLVEFFQEKTQHVLRIIQELMTNGAKYVKSGQISISVTMEFGNLYIIYEDNGPGFDSSHLPVTGLGLSNIFERAKILGGKAILDSQQDEGTKWRIRIPMKQ